LPIASPSWTFYSVKTPPGSILYGFQSWFVPNKNVYVRAKASHGPCTVVPVLCDRELNTSTSAQPHAPCVRPSHFLHYGRSICFTRFRCCCRGRGFSLIQRGRQRPTPRVTVVLVVAPRTHTPIARPHGRDGARMTVNSRISIRVSAQTAHAFGCLFRASTRPSSIVDRIVVRRIVPTQRGSCYSGQSRTDNSPLSAATERRTRTELASTSQTLVASSNSAMPMVHALRHGCAPPTTRNAHNGLHVWRSAESHTVQVQPL
jgi:hypothetical protein